MTSRTKENGKRAPSYCSTIYEETGIPGLTSLLSHAYNCLLQKWTPRAVAEWHMHGNTQINIGKISLNVCTGYQTMWCNCSIVYHIKYFHNIKLIIGITISEFKRQEDTYFNFELCSFPGWCQKTGGLLWSSDHKEKIFISASYWLTMVQCKTITSFDRAWTIYNFQTEVLAHAVQ